MMRPYSVFLRIEAIEALRDLHQRERDDVFRFARSLAENPFQESDRREADGQGRMRDVRTVGALAVVYYVDNADSEIKVLDVRLADD